MIKNFDEFINESISPFEDEDIKRDIECTGNAYKNHFMKEIIELDKNRTLEELENMDVVELGNLYNSLYWKDDELMKI